MSDDGNQQVGIAPNALYRSDVAKSLAGWGQGSWAAAKRDGLATFYRGGRCFVAGSELIRFITETGLTSWGKGRPSQQQSQQQ